MFFLVAALLASRMDDSCINAEGIFSLPPAVIITDCLATGYYCVLNNELAGSQTITATISGNVYMLKASFLFGGYGVAMQGTGKTAPDGDYIKYSGGGGCFVRISGPDAGKNIDGQWVLSPDILKSRYARLGITDFTGFGNLALSRPGLATFSRGSSITGAVGCKLTPWFSIAVDPSFITPGQTCTLVFKNDTFTPFGQTNALFRADDIGPAIKGKRIDIYLGEGQAALEQWLQSGGNRYVDVLIDSEPAILASSE